MLQRRGRWQRWLKDKQNKRKYKYIIIIHPEHVLVKKKTALLKTMFVNAYTRYMYMHVIKILSTPMEACS